MVNILTRQELHVLNALLVKDSATRIYVVSIEHKVKLAIGSVTKSLQKSYSSLPGCAVPGNQTYRHTVKLRVSHTREHVEGT